jgi:DNA-binding response OmpR family regulator
MQVEITVIDELGIQTNSDKLMEEKQRHHVLVVDDDPDINASISTALKNKGFRVSVANDGNQGVAFAESAKPDLVILDLMMPRRSGFLVLERLRQNSDTTMPVIVITGNEGSRHREYAELLGVNDYLQKPFTIDRLINSVKALLQSE